MGLHASSPPSKDQATGGSRICVLLRCGHRTLASIDDMVQDSDPSHRRFVVCTGGGPGIMEAANRGAADAQGVNIGLTISIPVEEFDNPFITE